MTTKVILEYQRRSSSAGDTASNGRILSDENGLIIEEWPPFEGVEFRRMLTQLAGVLGNWPLEHPVEVVIQRTDRAGLLPYRLDEATTTLLRTDPVAAIAAMEFTTTSPSTVAQRVAEEHARHIPPPICAGHATLADAFGDQVYFRVRGHELECPGCGFWCMFTSPGLLRDPERAGDVIKTAFVCAKKCGARFLVTCQAGWGYVDVSYLLEQTKLDAFYLPRAWNEGRPWVSRESLQKKYDEYRTEKEKVTCSETTP